VCIVPAVFVILRLLSPRDIQSTAPVPSPSGLPS